MLKVAIESLDKAPLHHRHPRPRGPRFAVSTVITEPGRSRNNPSPDLPVTALLNRGVSAK